MEQRRPTIKDVAVAAGVSITTVSNAINKRWHTMSADTLVRIQSAIEALDYRPSSVARELVRRHTATIAVVVAEIETPLFLQALGPIELAARRAGYHVLITNPRDLDQEQRTIDVLLEKEVNAAIFLSTSVYAPVSHVARLREAGIAVVLVNRPIDDEAFDTIDWDNAGAIELLVAHLVGLGHERIALLRGPQDRRSSTERLAGYRRALETYDLEYRDEYTPLGDYTLSHVLWEQAARDLLALPKPPTAIIASDDIVAAAVMQVIQQTGRRVPDDVAVVGVDDQPFGMYLTPPLTTARLPMTEAGTHTMDLIMHRLSGHTSEPIHIVLPCSLVVRSSSGTAIHAAER